MKSKSTTELACLRSLRELLWELATELDLHYESEDFYALSPSIEKMKRAVRILETEGVRVPEPAQHLVNRYARTAK